MQQAEFQPQKGRGAQAAASFCMAGEGLQRGGNLLALCMAQLFCLLLVFATYLFTAVLAETLTMYTAMPVAAINAIYIAVMVLIAFGLVLPAFVGRLRMGGLMAQGKTPLVKEMLYYYTAPRRYGRGVLLGILYALSLLLPLLPSAGCITLSVLYYSDVLAFALQEALAVLILVVLCSLSLSLLFPMLLLSGFFFSATALAVGDEHLSPWRAVCVAAGLARGRLREVFGFLLRALWRLLLSLCCIGVPWVLYYGGQVTLAYWHFTAEILHKQEKE